MEYSIREVAEMTGVSHVHCVIYDEEVSGCAEFLKAAVLYWAK